MIRVMAYLGEDDNYQLAELKIESLNTSIDGFLWQYSLQVAVDSGDEFCLYSRTFEHPRESENVLGLILNALDSLFDEEYRLVGDLKRDGSRRPWTFEDRVRALKSATDS